MQFERPDCINTRDDLQCVYVFRAILFVALCIAIRAGLARWVRGASRSQLWYIGVILLIQSLSFTLIYTYGLRKAGVETFGCPIWWNDMRPVHAIMYAIAAWFAIQGNGRHASTALSVDVIVGMTAFAYFHAKRTQILL
jgi:hypothetical protein